MSSSPAITRSATTMPAVCDGEANKTASAARTSKLPVVSTAHREVLFNGVSRPSLSSQSIVEPNKERRELVPWLHQEDRGQRIEDVVRKSGRLPFRQLACDLLTARRIPLTVAGGLAGRQPSWHGRSCVRNANQGSHSIPSVGNGDGRPREDSSSSLRSGKSCERRRNRVEGLCVGCHSRLSWIGRTRH